MKKITGFIHFFVRKLHIEGFFVHFLNRIDPFFTKFIPLPEEYNHPTFKTVTRNGVKFNLHLNDYMQWHIFADLPDFSWQKATEYLQSEGVILDIGANVGAFSLKLAQQIKQKDKQNCKVIAFEPNPFVCEAFQKNVSLNPSLQKIIRLEKIALGAKNEESQFVFSNTNSGGGKVLRDDSTQGISIEIKTLDNYLQEQKIQNVLFIKIDVEGFEPFVIEGAKETIRRYKPKLYIEMTEKWFKEHNSSTQIIMDYLETENYQLFVEMGASFIPVAKVNLLLLEQYNLLAI